MTGNIARYADFLLKIQMFSGYNKEDLERMFSLSEYEIKEYGKGQIIHLKSEECNSMDIVVNGRVMVQNIDESGNALTINVFEDGDIVGANLMFSKRNEYPMTVIAASRAIIIHIKRKLTLELCRGSESFMVGLLAAISDKAIILTEKINTISMKTIRQCIIDFLRGEHQAQNSTVIRLKLSKKNLAERLGIQRTSLSRELNKMRKEGLLEYDARTITIKNMIIINS